MKYGIGKYGVGKYGEEVAAGYLVFAKAGVAPDPVVDTPIATVEPTEATADLDVPFPGAAARMYGLVVPTNAQGMGLPGAAFAFAFDGGGEVDASPAPVTNLRLRPKAGGYVDVTWSYRDSELLLKAEQFEIEATLKLDSTGVTATLITTVVGRDPLRQDYSRTIGPMSPGLLTVRVVSATESSKVLNVQSASVRVDPTAPSDISLVLQAT